MSQLLRYDTNGATAVQALDGRVIAIELLGPDKIFYVFPELQGLRFADQSDLPPDVHITGAPLDLFALGRHGDVTTPGAVEIKGDLAVARQIQTLFAELDIDWEELLAAFTGDFLARKISVLATDFADWRRDTKRSLSADASDYLRYEQRLVPREDEGTGFYADLQRLHGRVARLEQRVQHLQEVQ